MGNIQGPNNVPQRPIPASPPAVPPAGEPAPGGTGKPDSSAPAAPAYSNDQAKVTQHESKHLEQDAVGSMSEMMDKKASVKASDPRGEQLLKALEDPKVVAAIDEALKDSAGDYEEMTTVILKAVKKLEKEGGAIKPGTYEALSKKFTGSNAAFYTDTLNRWIKQNYSPPKPGQSSEDRQKELKNLLSLMAGGAISICDNGPIC